MVKVNTKELVRTVLEQRFGPLDINDEELARLAAFIDRVAEHLRKHRNILIFPPSEVGYALGKVLEKLLRGEGKKRDVRVLSPLLGIIAKDEFKKSVGRNKAQLADIIEQRMHPDIRNELNEYARKGYTAVIIDTKHQRRFPADFDVYEELLKRSGFKTVLRHEYVP